MHLAFLLFCFVCLSDSFFIAALIFNFLQGSSGELPTADTERNSNCRKD